METRSSRKARRNPLKKHHRATPFSPPEPAIVTGKFRGRKLSELSNEELTSFMRWDAQCQTKVALSNIFLPGQHICFDLSQYWFAKYELERRKKTAECEPTSSIKLTDDDTNDSIALRLLNYGYWAASRKYHPDAGGDTRRMQKLNAARDYARARFGQ